MVAHPSSSKKSGLFHLMERELENDSVVAWLLALKVSLLDGRPVVDELCAALVEVCLLQLHVPVGVLGLNFLTWDYAALLDVLTLFE